MRLLRKAALVPAAVAMAGAAALLAPALPATAFISPPLVLLAEPESPARLVAGGAAVDVTMEYTCTADRMFIDVELTERVGQRVATGRGFTSVQCDGRTRRTVVRVDADSGPAFRRGRAAVETFVSGCRSDGGQVICGDDVVFDTIRVRR